MAKNTKYELRNMMMYQVFVRNFSEDGTFASVSEKLEHIKSLGTDIVWFVPIHPIGKQKRKGTLGSPYAISDYRSVNPEFGSLKDFTELVDKIHSCGMKCIIDVVYNHTSPDSVLANEHPDWFFHKADGSFGNRVGDWSDIIDLDYSNQGLWDYQIDTLKYWAQYVDGFRCDVAPMIPIEFWERARAEVAKVNKDCIWLSESIDPGFIMYLRSQGITAHSDCEMYRAFDIIYDYDIYNDFRALFDGSGSLDVYAQSINRQEYIYPENYVKLCFLENHDQTRARHFIPDKKRLINWTAFIFFRKGMTLIYNGQEKAVSHLPDLFNKDTISWNDSKSIDLSGLISDLSRIKKNIVFRNSEFRVRPFKESFFIAQHKSKDGRAVGIFSLNGETDSIAVELDDGIYTNELDGKKVEVFRNSIASDGEPIIIISEN